ncbi:MAG TPA: T9SS type A sorting domain-containing protein, partial [Bacteroidia bacterium]|nr:T9SS type A sorting domain-containing protein [Bacteroidia bacterium]
NITVQGTNTCGNGTVMTLPVRSTPLAPGAITGPVSSVCRASNQTYSIAAVSGATSYTWTVPSGATITNNSGRTIKVTFGSSFTGSGNVTVKANNSCGSSPVSTLAVSALTLQPGNISGATSVCKSQTSVTYSIAAVTGATSYTWTITGGATFVGSTTGTSVKVKFTTATSSSATLSVKANNLCGASAIRTLSIAVGLNCRTIEDVVEDEVSQIVAYPNPTTGRFTVAFDAKDQQKNILMVSDGLGNIVYREEMLSAEGTNLKDIDLRGNPVGIYFLVLMQDGEDVKTLRIVVQ